MSAYIVAQSVFDAVVLLGLLFNFWLWYQMAQDFERERERRRKQL